MSLLASNPGNSTKDNWADQIPVKVWLAWGKALSYWCFKADVVSGFICSWPKHDWEILTHLHTENNRGNLRLRKSTIHYIIWHWRWEKKEKIKSFFTQNVSTVGTDTVGTPPCRTEQKKVEGEGQSAVKLHRGAQDFGWKGCEERKVSERRREKEIKAKRRQQEEHLRKSDQIPTSLVQLPGVSSSC